MSTKIKKEYKNLNFQIRETSSENKDKYGNVTINITKDNISLYAENHILDKTSFDELEKRCKEIISIIDTDENVKICNACDFLYTNRVDGVNCEQSFSWADRNIFTHNMKPRYKSVTPKNKSKSCIYTTGFIFDTIHIITHLDDINPIFTYDELVDEESLVMTKGYQKNN